MDEYVIWWQREGRGTWFKRAPMKPGTTEAEALDELRISRGATLGADVRLNYQLMRVTTEVVE